MSVFKRVRSLGNTKSSDAKFSVQFRDHKGIVHRLAGFTSKSATAELDRAIQRLVGVRKVNGAFEAADIAFLEACPEDILAKLVEFGLIENYISSAKKSISEHLTDWALDMEVKSNTPKYVKETTEYVRKAVKSCKWRYASDINQGDFNVFIKALKDKGRSASTLNHSIRAMKSFCAWLKREKRATQNPVRYMKLLNQKADVRHHRRAMCIDELAQLLLFVERCGIKHHGLSGEARALLYHTAAHTGLRWSECRSIMRIDIDLEAEPPTVFLHAEYAKNRKDACLPLSDDLCARLKQYFTAHPVLPEARVFHGMWKDKGYEMLKKDVDLLNEWQKKQGKGDNVKNVIEWETVDGVLDFHALRTTFATMLSRAGVQLVTAQKLMRHSDPKLTANFYTRVVIQDQSAAINKLPNTNVALGVMEATKAVSGGDEKSSSTPAATKNMVTSMVTCRAESDGIIRNFPEDNPYRKAVGAEYENHEKSPENSGFRCVSGLDNTGAKNRIRTGDLLSHSPQPKTHNIMKINRITRGIVTTVPCTVPSGENRVFLMLTPIQKTCAV